MGLLQAIRRWTAKLPSRWGLGHSDIHVSLLFTLGLISAALAALALTKPGFYELHTAAITLPVVWTVSLAVRIAAQQLSVGAYSHDMVTIVGPTGNLSTDYEFLPSDRITAYSLAGQMATCGLLLLGATVNGAMLPGIDTREDLPRLFDFVCGWGSRAWASQIMWVNAFIGLVNLLPTIPFDMRATFFSIFSRRQRHVQEPSVFRRLASLDSHLSAVMVGIAVTAIAVSLAFRTEVVAWYAAAAAAVYLFVASRWEASRAADLEEQYAPIPPRVLQPERQIMVSSSDFRAASREDSASRRFDELDSSEDTEEGERGASSTAFDIDEILRKLHREGADSLSMVEQQALLTASRELQQKRTKR